MSERVFRVMLGSGGNDGSASLNVDECNYLKLLRLDPCPIMLHNILFLLNRRDELNDNTYI